MKQSAIDLQLLQHLQDSGFTKQQANILIDLHKEREGQLQNIADKRDILLIQKDIEQVHLSIEHLRADTKKDILLIQKEIEHLRADTKKDINNLSEKIEQLRADTKKDIEQVQLKIEMLKSSLTNRILVIMITATTLAVSALGLLMKFLLETA